MSKQKMSVATTKKHLTKQEIKDRTRIEGKLKIDREGLTVPGWLQDDLIAHNEFVRVVNEVDKIDILDNLDLSILAMYCKAYSSYVECTEIVDRTGYTVNTKSGKTISPYVTAQNKYAEQILKCSSKLGLSTTDRLKLVVPQTDEGPENKYLKYAK